MEKVDIEFAHIYTDEQYSMEQEISIELLNNLLLLKADSYRLPRLCILIDDYNPLTHELNIDEFIGRVESKIKSRIDVVALESKLVGPVNELIENLKPGEKVKVSEYIKKKGKYPCSLLSACWYLIRLGVIRPVDNLFFLRNEPVNFSSTTKIINLLPMKYKKTEESALDIIKKSNFKEVIPRIESIFY